MRPAVGTCRVRRWERLQSKREPMGPDGLCSVQSYLLLEVQFLMRLYTLTKQPACHFPSIRSRKVNAVTSSP